MPERTDEPPSAAAPVRSSSARTSAVTVAAGQVEAIVEAAERAAEQLRYAAEQRARERIAEADRAAELRVEAADGEARDVLVRAQAEADAREATAHTAVAAIHDEAARARAAAEAHRRTTLAAVQAEVERLSREAEAQAAATRDAARSEARLTLDEAHRAAREVLHEGEQVTGNLRALAQSLLRNAEVLTRDVKLAHEQMLARLQEVPVASSGSGAPDHGTPSSSLPAGRAVHPSPRRARGGSEPLPASISDLLENDSSSFDVPEFTTPPRRRRG